MEKRRSYNRVLDEDNPGLGLNLLWGSLTLISMIYGLAVRWRPGLYQWGVLRSFRPKVRTISVGNVTLGGSGKTPVVKYLAGWLRDKGWRVVVLSRGYRRRGKGVEVVSDGKQVLVNWCWVGDEPFLLATNLPGVPVVVGADRWAAAKLATHLFAPQVFILDDGFQHLRLKRDLDIVVIDSIDPFGNGRLFPRGNLREPVESLRRAHLFWLTRVDQARNLNGLREKLKMINPQAKVVESIHMPYSLREINGQIDLTPEALAGRKIVALSGIARPDSFEDTLLRLGASVMEAIRFPDHHRYSTKDLIEVFNLAKGLGAEMLVTTEKDFVRLPREGVNFELPTYYLKVEVEVLRGLEVLQELL